MKIEDYFVAQFHTVFFSSGRQKNHWTEKLGETTQSSPVLLTLPWVFEFFFVVSLLPTLKNQDMQWVERDVVSYFCIK